MEANKISSKIYKIQMDNATPNTEINNWINLQREVGNLASQDYERGSSIKSSKSNLVAQVEEAKQNLMKFLVGQSESYERKSVLNSKKVPTFEKVLND